jgi:hypothetical protein
MFPHPIHLSGEALFALSCAVGICSPFVLRVIETAHPGLPVERTGAVRHAMKTDDPATVALVEALKAQQP